MKILDILENRQVGVYETYEKPYWKYVAKIRETISGNINITLEIYKMEDETKPYRLEILDTFKFKHESYLAPLRKLEWTQLETEMQKINYNSIVRVQLSDKGKEIYCKIYGGTTGISENGFIQMPLWSLMSDFGPYMHAGHTFFEDGCIHMCNTDLEPSKEA